MGRKTKKNSGPNSNASLLPLIHKATQVAQEIHGFGRAELCASAIDKLPELFQVAYVAIYLYESEESALVFRQHNRPTPLTEKVPAPGATNLFTYALQKNGILCFSDLAEFERQAGKPCTPLQVYPYLQNYCCLVPLMAGEGESQEIIGMIILADRTNRQPFGEIERTMVTQMQLFLTYKLAYGRTAEPVTLHSIMDSLTGSFYWSAFYEHLGREMHRAMRYQSDLSLIILDIDKFQQVNTKYGTKAGDSVLREGATLIHQTLRTLDIVSRKDDTFFIVLPETKVNDAMIVAERLRKCFHEHVFKWQDQELRVTAGLGLVGYQLKDTPVSLIKKAELSLAHAKQKGGDQLVVYNIMEESLRTAD